MLIDWEKDPSPDETHPTLRGHKLHGSAEGQYFKLEIPLKVISGL